MNTDIISSLDELSERLCRLREFIEWKRLDREQQARPRANAFRLRSTAADDLDIAFGSFMSLAFDVQAALDGTTHGLPERERRDASERLATMVRAVQALHQPKGL
ncbi:MAG: hypothetical protein HKN91_03370 [Acidimicrobiia bacterium]|nr:hypothetical protein [Acidimicrobiia bacterium]